jgi:toxin ParE1/3/4
MIKTNKIHLKPKANEDLENIYSYSVLNFGKTKAIEYISDFDQAFINISKGESIGNNCDYIKLDLLKFNVNSHVVFYRLKQNITEIIRILHQKQDYPRHL